MKFLRFRVVFIGHLIRAGYNAVNLFLAFTVSALGISKVYHFPISLIMLKYLVGISCEALSSDLSPNWLFVASPLVGTLYHDLPSPRILFKS
jgi:hypothetical protein